MKRKSSGDSIPSKDEKFDIVSVLSTIGRLSISVSGNNENGSKEEEECILIHKYIGPVANVGLKARLVVNTGNYESVAIESSISIPCYAEEIDRIGKFADNWVYNKLDEQVGVLVGGVGSKRVKSEVVCFNDIPCVSIGMDNKGNSIDSPLNESIRGETNICDQEVVNQEVDDGEDLEIVEPSDIVYEQDNSAYNDGVDPLF